jgi:hypothetical protein
MGRGGRQAPPEPRNSEEEGGHATFGREPQTLQQAFGWAAASLGKSLRRRVGWCRMSRDGVRRRPMRRQSGAFRWGYPSPGSRRRLVGRLPNRKGGLWKTRLFSANLGRTAFMANPTGVPCPKTLRNSICRIGRQWGPAGASEEHAERAFLVLSREFPPRCGALPHSRGLELAARVLTQLPVP